MHFGKRRFAVHQMGKILGEKKKLVGFFSSHRGHWTSLGTSIHVLECLLPFWIMGIRREQSSISSKSVNRTGRVLSKRVHNSILQTIPFSKPSLNS